MCSKKFDLHMQFITLLNAFACVCMCNSMSLLKGHVLSTKSHHLYFHYLEVPLVYITHAYEKHSCSSPGFRTKLSGVAEEIMSLSFKWSVSGSVFNTLLVIWGYLSNCKRRFNAYIFCKKPFNKIWKHGVLSSASVYLQNCSFQSYFVLTICLAK